MNHYDQILEFIDSDIYEVIIENNVPHQFYTMRWFMLLMCQDFGMAETARLWDTLLAAVGPYN